MHSWDRPSVFGEPLEGRAAWFERVNDTGRKGLLKPRDRLPFIRAYIEDQGR